MACRMFCQGRPATPDSVSGNASKVLSFIKTPNHNGDQNPWLVRPPDGRGKKITGVGDSIFHRRDRHNNASAPSPSPLALTDSHLSSSARSDQRFLHVTLAAKRFSFRLVFSDDHSFRDINSDDPAPRNPFRFHPFFPPSDQNVCQTAFARFLNYRHRLRS